MNDLRPDSSFSAAPLESSGFILLHLDQPRPGDRLRPGSVLTGNGWVVSDSEITAISLFLDGQFLCHVMYGLPSPDIAARYPHYPHADHAGFSFSTRLADEFDPAADGVLTLRVQTAAGRETSRALPVRLVNETPVLPRSPSDPWPIRIALENVRLDGGGILRLSGWIVSLTPLTEVQVFFGDEPLAPPQLGLDRPDIAASHPLYPNAHEAGFRLVQDVGGLGEQTGLVRIQARCEGGVRRQILVPVEMPASHGKVTVQEGAIDVCIDSYALGTDGRLAVQGWAVSAAGISTVEVSLDGETLGQAESGQSRPDVGNRFPRIPSARLGGFRFTHQLGEPPSGQHLLVVRVHNGDGEERSVHLPLQAEVVADSPVDGSLAEAVRFDIDTPALTGDHASEPTRGLLTIGGWAVAAEGIGSIEVALDDVSIGNAHIGIRREDIGALFPELPGALLAGFAFTLPQRLKGEHAIRVTLHTKSGRVAERAFHVQGVSPEESCAALTIRHRLTQAEADFALEVLDRLGPRPRCTVFIRPDGPGTWDQVTPTLESIRRQAYLDWHAVVLLPPGPVPPDPFVDDPAFAGRVTLQPLTDGLLADMVDTGPADLVLVLAAGDRLGADTLIRFATEVVRQPGATLLYGDDRRYDPVLDAVQPFFKPDWSPELLLSTNYIGRAWCATGALLQAAGITVTEAVSSQDYGLLLRLTEAAGSIRHIPELLLDRTGRDVAGADEEQAALQAALRRRGLSATVHSGAAPGTWRVQHQVAATGLVSIIIPTCAARGLIESAIRTLRDYTPDHPIEIVCIDSIPADQTAWKDWLRENADVVVETDAAFNWSLYNNLGVAAANGDFLLFLNDDVEVLDPGWLPALLEHAQNPEVGVVGPQLLYPDGRVQHAGMFLAASVGRHAFRFAPADEPGPFGLALVVRNVTAVTGACMLMRRQVYEALGGFDEAHSVVNNDLDFCLRVGAAGLRVVFTPYAKLTHHELASRASISDVYDVTRFQSAWAGRFLKGDPYYNPSLSTDVDDYAAQLEPIEVLHVGRPLIACENVRAILAVKLDHIGDFVMAFPALRRLKQRFPKARLCVLGAKASGLLAALEPAIDEFIEFNFFHARSGITGTLVNEADLLALEARLRPYRFDVAMDLRMQGETRHVLRHCGATVLAGFEREGRFPWLDVAVEWEGDRSLTPKRVHAGDHLLQLVGTLAAACEREPFPVLPAGDDPAQDRSRLHALLSAALPNADRPEDLLDRPLVCVHTGAGSDMKQWPAASFAALIDLLVAEHGVRIMLIGVADEARVADEVASLVTRPEALIPLVGKVSLGDLPVLLKACRLFVGNDSGPKHLAASLGVPTLGIHSSNVDPGEWGPAGRHALAIRRRVTCGPCYIAIPSDCHRGLYCLRSIRPGDVFRACETLLRLSPAVQVAVPSGAGPGSSRPAKTARVARPPGRSKSRRKGVQGLSQL